MNAARTRAARALGLALPLLIAAGIAAASATTLTYQAVVRDSAGDPVADGAHSAAFSLWDAETLGNNVWNEAHGSVQFVNGAFSVQLGLSTPFGTLFQTHAQLWLEISVDTGGGPLTYLPRVPISASAYAFHAANADKLDGVDAADLEESLEITNAVTAHNTNASAHANINLDGARITSGKIANARLNTGPGQGLDADTVDGFHGADLEESAEIAAAVTAHNTDAGAHTNLALDGAQIATGTIANARLNTGHGGGLDADTVDGLHGADLEESAEIVAAVDAHDTSGAAHADIRASLADIGVPIGTIIPVYIGLPGVPTIGELQDKGWALCDGTTPASQGITGAVVTATPNINPSGRFIRGSLTAGTTQADNVGTHAHTATFSSGVTNTVGDHVHSVNLTTSSAGDHAHNPNIHLNNGLVGCFNCCNCGQSNAWSGEVHGANSSTSVNGAHQHSVSGSTGGAGTHSHTVTGTVTVNNNAPGGETRPINISMVFFIKVR